MEPGKNAAPFLPMSLAEARERGWDELDVIFVTGDAYVDHPSFAPALLGRMLESEGLRVGVIARPRVDHPEDVQALGRPKLFFAVSPGSVDSMINNYTAQKRPRHDDDYAPGGVGGGRPNRALIAYCNLLRRVYGKSAAILAGGVEASLRRFAHYDFWDDAVRRSVLLDAPADAIIYGMGERPLMEIARAMRPRMAVEQLPKTPSEMLAGLAREIRGAVWRCPASEPPPPGFQQLPSFESVRDRPEAQVKAFLDEIEHRAHGVYQDCAGHRVAANAPAAPLGTQEMDALYALPFRREAHPAYKERVPALDQVQFSITSHRGCFGGCAFCGIFTHQGKVVQSRSRDSILREVREIVHHPRFAGTIRDVGGPTANMWSMHCGHGKPCLRPSCLAPKICPHLQRDGKAYLRLLEAARQEPGVKHLFIGSGVRMDLALECEPFVEEFARHYTSGHAKVAPEHVVQEVLDIMMKPDGAAFIKFLERFRRASAHAGKEQYLLPYLIAAHPGSTLEHMIEVAAFLRKERLRVEQCQIFIPLPGTASAVMYATGVNPFTGRRVYVERDIRRREMQKALVLNHLPESRRLVEEALAICGRKSLASAVVPGGERRGYHQDAKAQRTADGGRRRGEDGRRTTDDGRRTTDDRRRRTDDGRRRTDDGRRRETGGRRRQEGSGETEHRRGVRPPKSQRHWLDGPAKPKGEWYDRRGKSDQRRVEGSASPNDIRYDGPPNPEDRRQGGSRGSESQRHGGPRRPEDRRRGGSARADDRRRGGPGDGRRDYHQDTKTPRTAKDEREQRIYDRGNGGNARMTKGGERNEGRHRGFRRGERGGRRGR